MTRFDEQVSDETDTWSRTITLAPEPISAVRARAFVCDCLTEHRMFALIDPIRLVTSELVTNAMRHAQTPITVSLALTDRGVLLTVTDGSLTLPQAMPIDAMSDGGRGLLLVDLLSTQSGVRTDPMAGSKSVWASFSVRGQMQDMDGTPSPRSFMDSPGCRPQRREGPSTEFVRPWLPAATGASRRQPFGDARRDEPPNRTPNEQFRRQKAPVQRGGGVGRTL